MSFADFFEGEYNYREYRLLFISLIFILFMSNTTKVWLGVIVAIIVIVIIYMYMPQSSSAPVVNTAQTTDTSVSSTTDTSDAAITQDMSNIDAQLSGLDTSQNDVNTSLNNQ